MNDLTDQEDRDTCSVSKSAIHSSCWGLIMNRRIAGIVSRMFFAVVVYGIVAAISKVDSSYSMIVLTVCVTTLGLGWASFRSIRVGSTWVNVRADSSLDEDAET